jgi:hypothetical protein
MPTENSLLGVDEFKLKIYENYNLLPNDDKDLNSFQVWYYGDTGKELDLDFSKEVKHYLEEKDKNILLTSTKTEGYGLIHNSNSSILINGTSYSWKDIFSDSDYGHKYYETNINSATDYIFIYQTTIQNASTLAAYKNKSLINTFTENDVKVITTKGINITGEDLMIYVQNLGESPTIIWTKFNGLKIFINNEQIDWDEENEYFKITDKFPDLSPTSPLSLTLHENGSYT